MGNKTSQKSKFNLLNNTDLKEFLLTINLLDGFYNDTNLSVSSRCLVILNNLVNHYNLNSIDSQERCNNHTCDILPGLSIKLDSETFANIERLKFNCKLIRHLSIFNSTSHTVEEFIELNNFNDLISLSLENLPIRFVHHLKLHRQSMIKLTVHGCVGVNLEELIESCGGDHSYEGAWTNLIHLDVRFNNLKLIDHSVSLLSALAVLDISRNNIDDLSFIINIPTLSCLNASFNQVKSLPKISKHCLRVLILGYNCLESLNGINKFKYLTTLNASFNMIPSHEKLKQLKEIEYLNDIILRGNPLTFSKRYRLDVLDNISQKAPDNFAIDGKPLSKREYLYLNKYPVIRIAQANSIGSNHLLPRDRSPYNGRFTPAVPIIQHNQLVPPNQSVGSSSAGSTNHRRIFSVHTADSDSTQINQQKFITTVYESGVLESGTINTRDTDTTNSNKVLLEKIMTEDGKIDTEYDTGTTDCSLYQSQLVPYFVGDRTSAVTYHDARGEIKLYCEVSVQLIDHQMHAVDTRDIIVDHYELFRLVVCFTENLDNATNKTSPSELHGFPRSAETKKSRHVVFDTKIRLIFIRDVELVGSNYELTVDHRIVNFYRPEELTKFKDQLSYYTRSFKVIMDQISPYSKKHKYLKRIILQCNQSKCQRSLSFNANKIDGKCFICGFCNSTVFKLIDISEGSGSSEDQSKINSDVVDNVNLSVCESIPKTQSAAIFKKTMKLLQTSNDHESSNNKSPSTPAGSTPIHALLNLYETPTKEQRTPNYKHVLNESNAESNTTSYKSFSTRHNSDQTFYSPPNDLDLDELKFDATHSFDEVVQQNHKRFEDKSGSFLHHQVPGNIADSVFFQGMKIHTQIGCVEQSVLQQVETQLEKSPWQIHHPMSRLAFYMHQTNKIDDRLKIHFLTKVLNNDEDIIDAYRVFLVHKYPCEYADYAILVITLERVLFYSIEDKEDCCLEDCLKPLCNFHMKNMNYINYTLNNQWLEFQFKNRTIFVFVGDNQSTKIMGSTITETVSLSAIKFAVRSKKHLDNLNSRDLINTIIDTCCGASLASLQASESYLMESCSIFEHNPIGTYVIRFVIVELDNLFFIRMSFPNKDPQQHCYQLEHTISLFNLQNKILLDDHNSCQCTLLLFINDQKSSVIIQLVSPESRFKFVSSIGKLWKDLFQMNLNYEWTTPTVID